MRKTNNYILCGIIILFSSIIILAASDKSYAQACDQLEIIYQQLDCDTSGQGQGQGQGGVNVTTDIVPVSVCVEQIYNYSETGEWATYQWMITSGLTLPSIYPNGSSANISINWPEIGTYILTLTVTDASGNVFTRCLNITVKEKPIANFDFDPQNNVCSGSIINFSNTTTPSENTSYSWDFGDPTSENNTSILEHPTHQYNTSGTYTVTLIAYNTMLVPGINGDSSLSKVTCCSDTIKKIVSIEPGTVSIECISTVCAGDTSTYRAVGCVTPTWFPPIGGTLISHSGNQVTIVWGNGNPQGQLSVQCGSGCKTYVTVPIVPSNPVIVGNIAPCTNSITSYSVPYLPGTYYSWTLTGSPNILLSTSPDNNTVWINWENATPGGTYQLSISLLNKHLCCRRSSGSITIIPKQKYTVYGFSFICAGQSASFNTVSVPSSTTNFDWTVSPTTGVSPASASALTGPFYATFTTAGTFLITANNSSNEFCNSTATTSVEVVPVPVPGTIEGPLTVCVGGQFAYYMSTNAPSGYYYQWLISGGAFQPANTGVMTGDTVYVEWTNPGTLTVVLKQSASPLCTSPSTSITVTEATVGSISGPLSVCVDGFEVYTLSGGNLPIGEVVTWTITPTGYGTIIDGDGTQNITVRWHGQENSDGPWGGVKIEAATACGPATALQNIQIDPKFTFDIIKTGIDICQVVGITLSTTGTPSNATYLWKHDDVEIGTSSSITNITSAGLYSATVTKGGCSYTQNYSVVDPFSIWQPACPLGSCNGEATNEILTVISSPSIGVTYQWYNPSSIAIPNATSSNYTAPSDGIYYVEVKYGTCTKTETYNVVKLCCPDVNQPSITTVTQSTCWKFIFTATTTNPTDASITWDFGDGFTEAGFSGVPITHTYAVYGKHCVYFCVGPPTPNPTNCTGNCDLKFVNVGINAMFEYSLGCSGCLKVTNKSGIFDNNPSYISYLWDFGDASFSSDKDPPQHCYSLGGTYTVRLTVKYDDDVNDIHCTDFVEEEVVYTPLSITNTSPVCTDVPADFLSSPQGFVSYEWTFGDNATAYISDIEHSYSDEGTKSVMLTVIDLLGETCTANTTVNVLPGINNCTISPEFICPGATATLSTSPEVGYTYLWEWESSANVFVPAEGTNNSNTYTTNVAGNYHVVVTNGVGCICISNTVAVKEVAKPKASFSISPSKYLCYPGGSIWLKVSHVNDYQYNWYSNEDYSLEIESVEFLYQSVSVTTNYNLIVTNKYGCKDTCTQTITVNPLPDAPIISPAGTLCEGVPNTLTVTNYNDNISWNNGATTTSITVTTAGVYIATYTDPITNCSASTEIIVNKRPSAGLFPHFCDSIPCNCPEPIDDIRRFVIYAPKPLIGLFASYYQINWYNANDGYLGSGPSYDNGGAGAETGSYYIIITDLITGCKDTSNTYSIVVLPCEPCEPCDCENSDWGKIILKTKGGDKPEILDCDQEIQIECNQPYTLNATYLCNDILCTSNVTFNLQPPSGPTITGDAPLNFIPTITGTYVLTLYGWCDDEICDSCVIVFKTDCPCCIYEISVITHEPDYDPHGKFTILKSNFEISIPDTINITEVRANVISYTITDNYNTECMRCVNFPFTWASVSDATDISTASPKITMYGFETVPPFNGSGPAKYQNPREIIWNNGSNINVPNILNIGMNFILPPIPAPECCQLEGKICVKFIFRDNDCEECEVISCFKFQIKKQ